MMKLSLTIAAFAVVIAAMVAPSLTARAQTAVRFEYARVTPSRVRVSTVPNTIHFQTGYRACVAASTEWTCREFPPTESSDAALRVTLTTLGNEGWELVSAVNVEPDYRDLTYLFKRPLR